MAMDALQQRERLEQFLARGRVPPAPRSPVRATNDVSDIAGARPELKEYAFTHKLHFHEPGDIKGSKSRQLHPTTRRVGDNDAFKQLPIEGTCPQPNGFRTDRVVNPLVPEYKLASFTPEPSVVPKFLRDSYNVSDIDGTKSRRREDDLPGAQSGWLPRHKRALREHPPRDILNARDITDGDFKSSRVTDVLNPIYTVNGMVVLDDPLSRPTPQHPQRNKPSFSLATSDILGASCSDPAKSVVAGIVNENRRDFRATNATADIRGAQADTLAHSIRSERRVDPNWPRYRVLDGAQVDASAISVGKSIVFADVAALQERQLLEKEAKEEQQRQSKPYVVSGVGNVGLVGAAGRPGRRASTSSVAIANGSNVVGKAATVAKRASASAGESRGNMSAIPTGLSRAPLAERKHAESRREDIELVRQLS